MDWTNERYVRVYTRDTTTWKLLGWQARTVLLHLFRKVDRAGVLDVGAAGVEGLTVVLDLPPDVVAAGLAALLQSRTVQEAPGAYLVPNFLEAQETAQSDAARARTSRERRRDLVRAGLRPDQRQAVVYFLQGDGGAIKIGATDDLAARIASLQTAHPTALRVLATLPGGPDVEAETHARFAHLRLRGEWFKDSPEIHDYIAAVTNRDTSHAVTSSHAASRGVTPSFPSRADPISPPPTPAPTPPGSASRAPRAPPAAKATRTTPAWAALDAERRRLHRSRYGGEPPPLRGAEASALGRMLAARPADRDGGAWPAELTAALGAYYADRDPFVARARHPLTVMQTRLARYLSRRPNGESVPVCPECQRPTTSWSGSTCIDCWERGLVSRDAKETSDGR